MAKMVVKNFLPAILCGVRIPNTMWWTYIQSRWSWTFIKCLHNRHCLQEGRREKTVRAHSRAEETAGCARSNDSKVAKRSHGKREGIFFTTAFPCRGSSRCTLWTETQTGLVAEWRLFRRSMLESWRSLRHLLYPFFSPLFFKMVVVVQVLQFVFKN